MFSLGLFCLALPGQSFIHSTYISEFVYAQGTLQGCGKNYRDHTWVLLLRGLQSNRKGKTGLKNPVKVENGIMERK